MAAHSNRPAWSAGSFDFGWLSLAALFVVFDIVIWVLFRAGSDWGPLWAAGRVAMTGLGNIFDFELITQLQSPWTGSQGFRPYIYPPSALLLIIPLAMLPFWPSYSLVVAGSLTCLLAGGRKVRSDILLLLLAPPVMIAAIAGQISLLVIGLVVFACAALEKRGTLAGSLFALAAMIKPTLLVLAPLGLVAGRHWGAMVAALIAGLIGILVSILLFGVGPWLDWFDAMPKFQEMLAQYPPLIRNAISPFGVATRFGLEHWSIIAMGAVISSIMVCVGFAKGVDPGTRSALLMGGALLITPYAMNYELAVFAPAMLILSRAKVVYLLLCAVWAVSLFFNAGIIGLLAAYAAVAFPLLQTRIRTKVSERIGTEPHD